jgi:hypothetical protein
MSSSGFVPMPLSNLEENEYCVSLSTPLSVEMVPLPSFNPPRQTADAFRFMMLISFWLWFLERRPFRSTQKLTRLRRNLK